MDTILGLLGMAVWIATTIAIAAGITYLVVKLFPGDEDLRRPDTADSAGV